MNAWPTGRGSPWPGRAAGARRAAGGHLRPQRLEHVVYWRVTHLRSQEALAARWQAQRAAYRDPVIWEAHRRELEEVVAFARARELPLLVAVFPHLADAGGSRVATGRVAAVFRAAGVPVLDLTERVAARELADWVVNAMDAHPNERLHEEVAARLLPGLRSAGIAERAAASFATLPAGR